MMPAVSLHIYMPERLDCLSVCLSFCLSVCVWSGCLACRSNSSSLARSVSRRQSVSEQPDSELESMSAICPLTDEYLPLDATNLKNKQVPSKPCCLAVSYTTTQRLSLGNVKSWYLDRGSALTEMRMAVPFFFRQACHQKRVTLCVAEWCCCLDKHVRK